MSDIPEEPPTPPKRKPGRPPGTTGSGPRPTHVILKDKRRVEKLWMRGTPTAEIVEEFPHLSPGTVYNYVNDALHKYRDLYEQQRPELAAQQLANLDRIIKHLEEVGDYRALAQFNKQKIEIMGLNAPMRHEVKAAVAVQQVPSIDLTGAPQHVLDAMETLCTYLESQQNPKPVIEAPIASAVKSSVIAPVLQLAEHSVREDETEED